MKKVALIGIGGMGFVHYNAYKKLDSAKIIAVADPRVEMAREKVGADDVNIYCSLEELLKNEKPDVVDICTPSYLHADIAVKAMEAGCDVLCEKPMSINSEDAARMKEVREKTGKRFMTAHVVRFMAPYVYLKSVIDSGELGKPVHIQMKRISATPKWSWENWMRDINKSGGSPIDLSIHDIDFVQYAFGEPKSVSGVYKKMAGNSDYIVSELIYDGFAVSITGGWYNADIPFNASYLAVFENGWIKFEGGRVEKNGTEVSLEIGEVSENTGINLSGADGYGDEIAYFIDCLEKGIPSDRVTPESSARSVKLVEKILANATVI